MVPTTGGTEVLISGSTLSEVRQQSYFGTHTRHDCPRCRFCICWRCILAGTAGTVDITVVTAERHLLWMTTNDKFIAASPSQPCGTPINLTAHARRHVFGFVRQVRACASDSDPENLPLSATLLSEPADGTLTFHGDGSFAYTPNPRFLGTDSFSYQASNGFVFHFESDHGLNKCHGGHIDMDWRGPKLHGYRRQMDRSPMWSGTGPAYSSRRFRC